MRTKIGCPGRFCGYLVLISALTIPVYPQQRIVVVGDVHGAYPEFLSILQRAGLIDASHQWTGGSAIFVQTGDVMDRGPESRKALDLLMALESEAKKQNGKVIPLLGNHEVMNIIGDLRYVSPAEYASFATPQSEQIRQKAYQEYREFLSFHPMRRVPDNEATRQAWISEHPLGFFEMRDAYGRQGVYGRWLRKHNSVAQIGDVLFMHGGLDPELHFRDIDQLNDRIRTELQNYDELWASLSEKKVIWRYMRQDEAAQQAAKVFDESQRGQREVPGAVEDIRRFLSRQDWLLISENSPLWYRGLALDPEEKLDKNLGKMLRRLNARYIVAAHTVRPKFNIMTRFDNRVFLIDTGMLHAYFGGRGSALEIQGGRFTAYYSDDPKPELLAVSDSSRAAIPGSSAGGDH